MERQLVIVYGIHPREKLLLSRNVKSIIFNYHNGKNNNFTCSKCQKIWIHRLEYFVHFLPNKIFHRLSYQTKKKGKK